MQNRNPNPVEEQQVAEPVLGHHMEYRDPNVAAEGSESDGKSESKPAQ